MKRAYIILSLVLFLALILVDNGGCVCRDGVISAQDITLVVAQGNYTLRTKWKDKIRDLEPGTNGTYRFQTPRMRWSDNVLFGVFSRRTSAEEERSFLHIMTNAQELLSLSPEQIWHLPKNEAGISVLNIK